MRPCAGPLLVVLFSLAPAARPRAIALTLNGLDIARALDLAKQSESQRAAFHAGYIVKFNSAVVEQLEVITEFRRVELVGEDRVRFGDYMFTVQKARAAVAPWQGKVDDPRAAAVQSRRTRSSPSPRTRSMSGRPATCRRLQR